MTTYVSLYQRSYMSASLLVSLLRENFVLLVYTEVLYFVAFYTEKSFLGFPIRKGSLRTVDNQKNNCREDTFRRRIEKSLEMPHQSLALMLGCS